MSAIQSVSEPPDPSISGSLLDSCLRNQKGNDMSLFNSEI